MSLVLILLFFFNSFGYNKSDCACTPAKANEIPWVGNVIVETNGGIVKKIKGRVTSVNGESFNFPIIVEVFDYKDSDEGKSFSQITESKKRRTACKVSEDGYFCFKNLHSGKYLLRVGALKAGFESPLIKVTLVPKDIKISDKDIEIILTAAG